MKFRELEKKIKADGWKLQNVEGSHYHYFHGDKPGKTTIPYHSGDIDRAIVNSVLKQAGLKQEKTT